MNNKTNISSFSQDIIDRAVEWVGINYPSLDGEAFDAKVTSAAYELSVIDSEVDAIEASLAR